MAIEQVSYVCTVRPLHMETLDLGIHETVILPSVGLMILKSARYPRHPQMTAHMHSPHVKGILT